MDRAKLLAYARDRLGLDVAPPAKDRQDLIGLTRSIYPTLDIGEAQYLRWQDEENPAGRMICRLAKSAGQAIGAFTLVPLNIRFHGQPAKAALSVNTMTHPRYRGQGVFPILGQAALDTADLTHDIAIGFPNTFSHKGFVRDLGFQDLGELPLWICPLQWKPLAEAQQLKNAPLIRGALRLGHPLSQMALQFWHGRQPAHGIRVEEIGNPEPLLSDLWQRVQRDYPTAIERSGPYLTWRFFRHPTRRYRIYVAYDGSQVGGYLVTRQDRILGLPSGCLVDLLVPKSARGRQTAIALVRQASRDFREQGAVLAAALMPDRNPGAAALRRLGYARCPRRWLPQPFPFIFRWCGEGAKRPVPAMQDWYLTMGDYDAV